MWLIDANRLYDAAEEKYMEDRSKTENVITRVMLSQARQKIQELIAYAPSVDAEPVVRCKDCINYIGGTCWRCGLDYAVIVDADDFCSRGVTE